MALSSKQCLYLTCNERVSKFFASLNPPLIHEAGSQVPVALLLEHHDTSIHGSLRSLLAGCAVAPLAPVPYEPAKSYEAFRHKLENIQYEKMTASIFEGQAREEQRRLENASFQTLHSQSNLLVNLLLSSVGVGVAIGWWQYSPGAPLFGVTIGALAGVAMLIVEVVLFMIRADRGDRIVAESTTMRTEKLHGIRLVGASRNQPVELPNDFFAPALPPSAAPTKDQNEK